MPALVPTDHVATVTWLGRVEAGGGSLRSAPLRAIDLDFAGPRGEAHAGETRPSCSRVVAQHPRGTEIRNVRQLSLLSGEEMATIAETMGLAALDPAWLGATVVVEGIADFSHVPPSARLQSDSGTTLVIDMQNRPCLLPAREIDRELPGRGTAFKSAAEGRRGVTAWVERPGALTLGDRLRLHVPDQRAWAPGSVVPGLEGGTAP